MKLLPLLLLLGSTSVLADDEVALLYEGNLQHQQRLSGLQFHLNTTHWIGGDYDLYLENAPRGTLLFGNSTPTKFKETLAIRYDPADIDNPWRTRWVREYPEATPEPFLQMRAFFVLDDSHLRKMVRPDYRQIGKLDIAHHEDYFQALTAGASVLPKGYVRLDHFYFDPASKVLLVNSKTNSIFLDPTGDGCRDVEGWQVASHGKFLERDSVRLEYHGQNPAEAAHVIVLAAPDFTVVEVSATEKTSKGTQSVQSLTTTELGIFDGVTYPKKGTVAIGILYSKDGDVWPLITEFEIVSVERIPESVLTSWVPELPPGTNFIENDRITNIPFDEEFRNASFRSAATSSTKTPAWRFIPLLLIALGFVGIICWRRWRYAT